MGIDFLYIRATLNKRVALQVILFMERGREYLVITLRIAFLVSYLYWLFTLLDYDVEWNSRVFYVVIVTLCLNGLLSVGEYFKNYINDK
jgi:hypothetical protein